MEIKNDVINQKKYDFWSMFKELNGKWSSSRYRAILWATGAFLIWTIISLNQWELQAIPETVLYIILAQEGATALKAFAGSIKRESK